MDTYEHVQAENAVAEMERAHDMALFAIRHAIAAVPGYLVTEQLFMDVLAALAGLAKDLRSASMEGVIEALDQARSDIEAIKEQQ